MKRKVLSLILTTMLCFSFSITASAAEYVEVIPCQYDDVNYFKEGLVSVSISGKYAVIDKTGKEIVAPKYDYIEPFSDGLAIFNLNGKYGAIDTTGKEIVAPKYDYIEPFSDDLAIFNLNGKYGVIDTTGKEIVAPKYDLMEPFSEGLAIFLLDSKKGVIDTTGKEIVMPDNHNYTNIESFSGGMARVTFSSNEMYRQGYIDKTGQEVIAPKYDLLECFSEGLAVVRVGDLWGVVDKTGKEVIPPNSRYDTINSFSEGLATVFIGAPETGGWGVIDKTGKEVVSPMHNPKYNMVGGFSYGVAVVVIDYKYGFIDTTGKEVVPLKYGRIDGFYDGLAAVRLGDWETGKWGVIDTTGKEIVAPKYDEVFYFNGGLARVKLNGKYGLIDKTGKEVVVPKYDDMQDVADFSEGMIGVQMAGKWGFIALDNITSTNPSSWAVEQVNAAITAGLVPQSLQSKYIQSITRAEYCALAVALYEKYTGEEITERNTFNDTKDVNVEKMAAVGVVSGLGNNLFDPDAKLTREQAAVMLSRLADAIGKPLPKQAATFNDNPAISSWAFENVGQVQAAGIMSGIGSNIFAPKDPYTREQSIITIIRLFNAIQ